LKADAERGNGRDICYSFTQELPMATTDSINEAATLEAYAADGVEAAVAEFDPGNRPFTIGLLLDAAQKERESLDAIEESMETLRLSLAQRRRAIDQQDEILRDLSEALSAERTRKNAKG
jgi:hypothetical protein